MKRISPGTLHKVLRCVEDQCKPPYRVATLLTVEDVDSQMISFYCQVLTDLGFIETQVLPGQDFDHYYPVRITGDGIQFLDGADRGFWDAAEKCFVDTFVGTTGIAIGPFVSFFRETYQKYKRE